MADPRVQARELLRHDPWCGRTQAMRFLPTMQLKVELFAGTDIADAATDLCELANRVGTLCVATFNGVQLWARPGDDPARLVAAWDAQTKRPSGVYKIAQARDADGVLINDGKALPPEDADGPTEAEATVHPLQPPTAK